MANAKPSRLGADEQPKQEKASQDTRDQNPEVETSMIAAGPGRKVRKTVVKRPGQKPTTIWDH